MQISLMFCFPSCSCLQSERRLKQFDEEQLAQFCLSWTESWRSEQSLCSSQKHDLKLPLLFQITERTESLNRSLKKRWTSSSISGSIPSNSDHSLPVFHPSDGNMLDVVCIILETFPPEFNLTNCIFGQFRMAKQHCPTSGIQIYWSQNIKYKYFLPTCF